MGLTQRAGKMTAAAAAEVKVAVKAGQTAIISGNTYPIRDSLRKVGYAWQPNGQCWTKTYTADRVVTYIVHPRCALQVAGSMVYDDTHEARNARHDAARYGLRQIPGSCPDDTY